MDIKCFLIEATGKTLTKTDEQTTYECSEYRNLDTGETGSLSDLGPGAMWYADNRAWSQGGLDGRTLCCLIPDAAKCGYWIWNIDGRCSNCTKPEDTEHRCWCRHGEAPSVTVDKVGNTCSAGGGSIITDSWHGFLREGYLRSC